MPLTRDDIIVPGLEFCLSHMMTSLLPPDWNDAPENWNWLAQDEDGRWFWYAVQPVAGIGGGVWRSPSRAQQFAGQGKANPRWQDTLFQRPGTERPAL